MHQGTRGFVIDVLVGVKAGLEKRMTLKDAAFEIKRRLSPCTILEEEAHLECSCIIDRVNETLDQRRKAAMIAQIDCELDSLEHEYKRLENHDLTSTEYATEEVLAVLEEGKEAVVTGFVDHVAVSDNMTQKLNVIYERNPNCAVSVDNIRGFISCGVRVHEESFLTFIDIAVRETREHMKSTQQYKA